MDLTVGNVDCHHDLCFTLKFKGKRKDLYLVAETKSIRNKFANLVNSLIMTKKSLNEEVLQEKENYEM